MLQTPAPDTEGQSQEASCSPMNLEISCVQSVPACLGKEPSAILSCKSVGDSLQFLIDDTVRKQSSCGVFFFFLGCQFRGLSLTSTIRDGTRFHTKQCCNFCRKGHIQISQTWYVWRRHQLTTVVGSMLTGAAHQGYNCKHLGYQNLKIRVNSRISCLALAEEIWQVSHAFKPNTQSAVQPSNAFFLTDVAQFMRKGFPAV